MANVVTVPQYDIGMNPTLSETIFNMARSYGVESTLDIKEHDDTVLLLHNMGFNLVDQSRSGSFSRPFSAETMLLYVKRGRGNLPINMPDTQAFEAFDEVVGQGNWPVCFGYMI